MISGGNAVVFGPHPSAKRITWETIKMLNKAISEETGITNLLTCVKEPSIESAQKLFTSPGINLLVVTGGEAVVKAARDITNKWLIAAGAGNPPVVVDETADLKRAARSIYDGASFDNNIVCCDEKEIIAVESIADELKQELSNCGAMLINRDQADALLGKFSWTIPVPMPGPTPNGWERMPMNWLRPAGSVCLSPAACSLWMWAARPITYSLPWNR